MTVQEYTNAVQAMVALPPEMLEHLLGLAGKLNPEALQQLIDALSPEYAKVDALNKKIVDDAEAGIREIDQFMKHDIPVLRNFLEQEERGNPDAILDDPSAAT